MSAWQFSHGLIDQNGYQSNPPGAPLAIIRHRRPRPFGRLRHLVEIRNLEYV
jgi:hypothetical protein